MGRNNIPKLGEWRDGYLYQFRWVSAFPPHSNQEIPVDQQRMFDDGSLIVYERKVAARKHGEPPITEILATAYADGTRDVMASMFRDGYFRGLKEGKALAKAEIRAALGIEKS